MQIDRNLIPMSDDEIEAKFDVLGYGLCVSDLSLADDTIDDFLAARARGSWREAGRIDTHTADTLVIRDVQPAKGQPRRDVVVIDLGPARALYGATR